MAAELSALQFIKAVLQCKPAWREFWWNYIPDSYCLILPLKSEMYHRPITINYLSAGVIPCCKWKKGQFTCTMDTKHKNFHPSELPWGWRGTDTPCCHHWNRGEHNIKQQHSHCNYLPSLGLLWLLKKKPSKLFFGYNKLLKAAFPSLTFVRYT